jgi:hypothetical protein
MVVTHLEPPGIRPTTDQAKARGSGVARRARALTQHGAQQRFGGIGGRARGDRAGMGAVELTQLDAVKSDPGIMDREFQLPCCLIDLHLTGVCPGNAHCAILTWYTGPVPVFVIQVPRMIAAMHARHPARLATYHKASGLTARGSA